MTYKELLAVVTFVKHFRHYLLGRHFKVRSDHGSLRWLTTWKDLDSMPARWMARLSLFDFDLEHRKGTAHGNADGLSRHPLVPCKKACIRPDCPDCTRIIEPVGPSPPPSEKRVDMTSREGSVETNHSESLTEVETTIQAPLQPDVARATSPADTNPEAQFGWLENWGLEELATLQQADPSVSLVAKWKGEGVPRPPQSELAQQSELVRALCSRWESLELLGGVLYRRWGHKCDSQKTQLHVIVPESLKAQIFQHLHSNPMAGHLGITRTLERVRSRFFWPGCKSDIRRWCQECVECARAKAGPGYRARLHQVPVGAPLERVAIDICGELPETERGNKYVLVLCDYWTKWVSVFALPDQTALTCADAIVNGFTTIFGVPRQMHSDQGRSFESALFAEMSRLLGTTKTRTTPYHPQ